MVQVGVCRSQRLVNQYLQDYPEIYIEFPPVYAPGLNPEEFCHGNVKRLMKNAIFLSTTEIRKSLDLGFARLR